ncbi:serine/threonine protein kinase [Rhodopseudomonas palustris]|uniref:Serine/threonine protein kinase n=1 Tax=Rhodopseudomonas palustris TaxID=1076 RepID=A0AAX3DTU9_RHOPL|nr:serine/threonine-protein kinase [Rhodopseudomonas palustris]UYO37701.1 serine/threonine protein kinase [Rhodopseudomonas palustris]
MTLISNLRIGPKIGNGHFGEVHLGSDDVHGPVAVKIFTKDTGETDGDWSARKNGLLAEGQRLSRAEHPNVVKVHALLESATSDAVHLVMDYCPGGCLQKKFELGPMTLAEVRRYATQVAMGLAALHARNLLHRDIKPANILLNRHGAAQLGDFGLVTDNIVLGYASQAGYSDHLAPEVINGGGTSVKTDVWALGMTLYRLIHGQEWYSRLPQPRHVVGRGGFARHLPWLPHVPKSWRTFIRTMLHDDTSSRYQSANEISGALAKLQTTPRWECSVSPHRVHWKCEQRKRRFFVTWDQTTSTLYDWKAWSEPIGSGNKRSLGGSTGVTYDAAERELTAMFARITG